MIRPEIIAVRAATILRIADTDEELLLLSAMWQEAERKRVAANDFYGTQAGGLAVRAYEDAMVRLNRQIAHVKAKREKHGSPARTACERSARDSVAGTDAAGKIARRYPAGSGD